MKVLVIGAGNMGIPLAHSISKSGKATEKVAIYDRNADKIQKINEEGLLEGYTDLKSILPKAEVVFLAIKPHDSAGFFKDVRNGLQENQILVSIMAGVTLSRLTDYSGLTKIIRMMPNLPAKIGEGISTFVRTEAVGEEELQLISDLLQFSGELMEVESEKLVDASTSISGTGPAYVFYFMKCLMESAMNLGFSKSQAEKLVSQTFKGSISLFFASNHSPETWIQRVASKGGTTEAALKYLKDERVNDHIIEAARQAFLRSEELGKDY